MRRKITDDLISWKNKKNRKPLILNGARQVGKTWILKEFGRNHFKKIAYINFESNALLKDLFILDFDIKRIITVLEIQIGTKINAGDTLIIFDEIQEAESGLTSLKYFYENAPQYFIIAAGSLLGLSIQKSNSYPIGKVDFMKLYPMSFTEFIDNCGEEILLEQLQNFNWPVIETYHEKLIDYLRTYYFVGGMPEVVASYLQEKDMSLVRNIQKGIINGYENDFAKYATIDIVPRIKMVWQSIISQLSKENRKFTYSLVQKGARAKDFELAIQWLQDAGLILKINRVTKPSIPLNAYTDFDAFKIFLLDIGLINAMANVDVKILLEKNTILSEFKGALTEQYVCQQLFSKTDIFYWTAANATAELDFLIQVGQDIFPIEVKAEENLKSKSLRVFIEKHENLRGIRLSMSKFRNQEWMVNYPLYACDALFEIK